MRDIGNKSSGREANPLFPHNPLLCLGPSPLEVSLHFEPTPVPEGVVYHFQQSQKGHPSLLESK